MAKTLTVRVDDALEQRLTTVAQQRGLTESQVVRDLLDRGLARAEFRALREKIVALAAAAGYLTDEDVFRDVS